MLAGLTVLLLFQLAGELLARLAGLPVPGPVLGMVMLFAFLVARGGAPRPVGEAANGLLTHLSLLFVPAGAGIMVHAARLSGEWAPILAALVASTLLTMGVTALVLKLLMGRREDKP